MMAGNFEAAPGVGARVVAIARRWIGTPYQHQASCEGAGADCLGLLRGIWREVFGAEPEEAGAYTPDWSESDGSERLLAAAMRHLDCIRDNTQRAGDILLFRMKDAGVAKHLAVLENAVPNSETIIHAYSGYGVIRSPLGAAWKRRIVARFRFPDGSS